MWPLLHGLSLAPLPWVQPPPESFECEHLAIKARRGLVAGQCSLPDPYTYEHPASRFRSISFTDTSGWGPAPIERVLAAEGCKELVTVRPTVHQGHLALDHVCHGFGVEVIRAVQHDGRWLVASMGFWPVDPAVALERADAVFDQVRFRDLEVGR